MVPKIDRFGFAICEVSSYPITPFFTFLERYEDFASFGGCFAQFQCVFAALWVFQGCPSFKHSFQDTNMVLKFMRSVRIRLPSSKPLWKAMMITLLFMVVLLNFNCHLIGVQTLLMRTKEKNRD